MAIIIPPGFAQVTLGFTAPSTRTGNTAIVLGFGRTLGPDPYPLEDFATEVALAWAENMAPVQDNATSLTSIRAVTESEGFFGTYNVPGTGAFTQPPPQVAVLVTKVTESRGRRGRGRIFLYGACEEADIDERGNLTSDRRTAVQTAVNGFFADLATAVPEADHVILQSDSGLSPAITPPPIVTGTPVQTLVSTQRRRLR